MMNFQIQIENLNLNLNDHIISEILWSLVKRSSFFLSSLFIKQKQREFQSFGAHKVSAGLSVFSVFITCPCSAAQRNKTA